MGGDLGSSIFTSESANFFLSKWSEFMIAKHFGNSPTKLQRKGIRQNEDGLVTLKMELGGMDWIRH